MTDRGGPERHRHPGAAAGRDGLRRARRCPRLLGVVRNRRAVDPASARRGRSSTRATGRRRSRISRGTSASSPSTAAATVCSDRPEERAAYHRPRVRRRRGGGARRGRRRARVASPACRCGGAARAAPRGGPSGAHRSVFALGSSVPLPHVGAGGTRRLRLRRRAGGRTRAGRSSTATTGCATSAGFLEFFFGKMLPGAALDEADRGLRRLGTRHDGRDARADHGRRDSGSRTSSASRSCCAVSCPVARAARHRRSRSSRSTAASALAELLPAASSCALEGAGHCAAGARPCRVNLIMRELRRARRAAPPATAWRRARSCARSARSSSRRRSASATPGATSRSPTSCGAASPGSRSTGSRRTR